MKQITEGVSLNDLSKRASNSPKSTAALTILKWLTLLDAHFNRKECLSPEEKKIYIEALQFYRPESLDTAFQRCLHECQFMPKIVEIEERLPHEPPAVEDSEFRPVKDWTEPFSRTARMHVYEDGKGNRRVKFDKIVPQEITR